VVREAILERLVPDALVEKIFGLVARYAPKKVIIEDEGFQKTLYYWVRKERFQRDVYFPLGLEKNPRNVSRESRLLSLQPFLHHGAIQFAKNMPGREELLEELETFPRGPHKDLLAALYFATRITYPPVREKGEPPIDVPPRSRLLYEMMHRKPPRRHMPRIAFGRERWTEERFNALRKRAGV
jgi:hypothetical protein